MIRIEILNTKLCFKMQSLYERDSNFVLNLVKRLDLKCLTHHQNDLSNATFIEGRWESY